jgi:hypothetical protein
VRGGGCAGRYAVMTAAVPERCACRQMWKGRKATVVLEACERCHSVQGCGGNNVSHMHLLVRVDRRLLPWGRPGYYCNNPAAVTPPHVLRQPVCAATLLHLAVMCLQRLKVLRPLSEPDTFCTTLWRPVKGVLFYGPPGTGAWDTCVRGHMFHLCSAAAPCLL